MRKAKNARSSAALDWGSAVQGRKEVAGVLTSASIITNRRDYASLQGPGTKTPSDRGEPVQIVDQPAGELLGRRSEVPLRRHHQADP